MVRIHFPVVKKVVFEGDIIAIDSEAFCGCSNLEYITQSNYLTFLGYNAFYNCKKLTYFYLPPTLTKIVDGAFYGSGLTSVVIPSKAKFVNYYNTACFKNCKSLKTVVFEDRKDTLEILNNSFENCTALETLVLPTSTKDIKIYRRAFKNCTNLNNILNTEDITYIGDAAFAFCKNLKSISFSSKLDWILEKVFYGCEKLSSITFTGPISKTFRSNAFLNTPENLKFYVKDAKTAKLFKDALKGSGVKNARIYVPQSSKLVYKNVK